MSIKEIEISVSTEWTRQDFKGDATDLYNEYLIDREDPSIDDFQDVYSSELLALAIEIMGFEWGINEIEKVNDEEE